MSRIFSFRQETRLSYRSLNLVTFRACIILASLAASPAALIGQEQNTQEQTHAPQILVVPAPLGGTSPQLLPTGEAEARNLLQGGVTVGTLFDDNAAAVGTQRHDEYQYFVLPSIAFQQTRPHTAWSLDYHGGITIQQAAVNSDTLTQNSNSASADLQHVFARRLLLELRDDYVRTNNPFDSTQGQSPATLSGVGQLNPFLAVPAATRIANVSLGSLTYQLTRHSSTGIGGSYSSQRFHDVSSPAGLVSLIDTRAAAGKWFYVYEISQSQRIGFEYQVQDLRFQGSAARTLDQTLFLFDQITLQSNMTLTLFAGPDRTHLHDNLLLRPNASASVVPTINDIWFPAGGATFMWRGRYLAMRLTGQRLVTDGSGSTGAVRATSASAELRKDFTRKWTISLGYLYSEGQLLGGLGGAANSRITVGQGSLILERRLAEHFVVRAQYARVQQVSAGAPAPLTTGNHNRVGLEVAYQFARPLGR